MRNRDPSAVLDEVAGLLGASRSALFITGAGLSADSGLPTYRGIGGLYAAGATDEGISIEAALSGFVFAMKPAVTWKYLHQLGLASRGAAPNTAHLAIAGLEERLERCIVLTQNVDGFHREAGSRCVIDIHGDLRTIVCTSCTYRREGVDIAQLDPLPKCPVCGSVVRPDVVLFGELLPREKVLRLRAELERGFDVVFAVGTSAHFPYVARPVLDAARRGVPTVEINPGETPLSEQVRHRIRLGAKEAFEALMERLPV